MKKFDLDPPPELEDKQTTLKTLGLSSFIKSSKNDVKKEYHKIYDKNFLFQLKEKQPSNIILEKIKNNIDLPKMQLTESKKLKANKFKNMNIDLNNKSDNPYIIKKFHDLLVDDKMDDLNINAMLNKLTPENFDKLTENLIQLIDESSTNLKLIADLLYEHAIDSELYCQTYANLAKKLSHVIVRNESTEEINFREYFINKCKKDFTRELIKETEDYIPSHNIDLCNQECEKCDGKDIINARLVRERRQSNVKAQLIGELYKLDMFEIDWINVFIEDLLMEESNEYAMEKLCKLFTTCGKCLEEAEPNRVNIYLEKIEQILIEKIDTIKPRVRFMILDLIDLRKNNWIPRHELIVPKKIEKKLTISKSSETVQKKEELDVDPNSNTNIKIEQGSNSSHMLNIKKRKRKSSININQFHKNNNSSNQKDTSGNTTRNNQKFRTKTKVFPKKHI